MNREFYTEINFSPRNNVYTFESEGRYGSIPKIVVFQQLSANNYFNLFLSDFIEGKIANDEHITDNGDMPKVMATIIRIVYHFTTNNPESFLY